MSRFPYRQLGIHLDRNYRNSLNANFVDIEADIKELGAAPAEALAAADEANTQAVYAQEQGDFANVEGTFASEQGTFAQTQGTFAQEQGDYALEQGDYAKQVGDENKTRFLAAVVDVTERDTNYPAPVHGDTVRVTGEAKTYRFVTGSGWVVTDEYNPTAIDEVNAQLADKANVSQLADMLKYEPDTRNVVYLDPAATGTINGKPVYNSLQAALDAITDASFNKPYVIKVYPGNYVVANVTPKDYVDVEALYSYKNVSKRTMFVYVPTAGNNILYDLIRTSTSPVGTSVYNAPVSNFPIHSKFKNIYFRARNANYCVHADFNQHPDIDLLFENCYFEHQGSDDATTTFGYGVGIGEYGGQKIRFKDCKFQGKYYAGKQHAGFVWHSRDGQTQPCSVEFLNCESFGGNFGARIVSYNSGQTDSIILQNCSFRGRDGSLLILQTNIVDPFWADIDAKNNEIESVIYTFDTLSTNYRIHSEGWTKKYYTLETLAEGDVVVPSDFVGGRVQKGNAGTLYYKTVVGVVHKSASAGTDVIVQIKGIANVITDTAVSGQSYVGTSKTVFGHCESVASVSDAFGVALATKSAGEKVPILLKLK
jgi:hypothetical protein